MNKIIEFIYLSVLDIEMYCKVLKDHYDKGNNMKAYESDSPYTLFGVDPDIHIYPVINQYLYDDIVEYNRCHSNKIQLEDLECRYGKNIVECLIVNKPDIIKNRVKATIDLIVSGNTDTDDKKFVVKFYLAHNDITRTQSSIPNIINEVIDQYFTVSKRFTKGNTMKIEFHA